MSSLKVAIFTFGCKVNQYESQCMREQLTGAGFSVVEPPEKADIYIINTCTVTREADRQARQYIRKISRNYPTARIAVTGCYAQRVPQELKSLFPEVSVLSNNQKTNIINCFTPSTLNSKLLTLNYFADHTRAFVKVQDGCDHFCAYCIVPYVRPKIYSRDFHQILEEVETLVKNGYQEIVLTGIRLGRYKSVIGHRSSVIGLMDLIKEIHQIEGLKRIRLSSLEPTDIDEGLIKCMATLPKVCPHLHIPLQSGDDEILKKMRRDYTREAYQHMIQLIRTRIPNIAITTDVMAGFPGESEQNFNNTCDFVKGIGFSKIHVFRFSPRPGTLAFNLPEKLPSGIIKNRIRRLLALSNQLAEEFAKQFIGKTVDILVEKRRDLATNLLSGLIPQYLRVGLAGPDELKNNIVKIKITGFEKGKLRGG